MASAKAAVIKLKIARDILPCGCVRQIVSLVHDDFCIFDEGKRQKPKGKNELPDRPAEEIANDLFHS